MMNRILNRLVRMKQLLYVSIVAAGLNLSAQEVKIKSFSMQMEPMTVPMQRTDNNGEICALVKVIIPTSRATFEGSLIGECDYKTAEYWCYLSPGSKRLKIKIPDFEPLMVNFESFIGTGVKSKQVYELKIEVPHGARYQESFNIEGKIYIADIDPGSKPFGKFLEFSKLASKVKLFHNYKNGNYVQKLDTADLKRGSAGEYLEYKLSDVKIGDSLTVQIGDSRYASKTIVITPERLGRGDLDITLSKKVITVICHLLDGQTKKPVAGVELQDKHQRTGDGQKSVTDKDGTTVLKHRIDKPIYIEYRNLPEYYKKMEGYISSGTHTKMTLYVYRKEYCNWIKLDDNVSIDGLRISTDNDNPYVRIVPSNYSDKLFGIYYPYGLGTDYMEIRCDGYKTVRIFNDVFPSNKPLKMKRGKESECIGYRYSNNKISKTELKP